MFIGFPSCTWKCERDCGQKGLCQNAALAQALTIEVESSEIVQLYLANPLSHALVCGGLEPFDSAEELLRLVHEFRMYSLDEIIIYTGYTKEEVATWIQHLREYPNIIVKFGRFRPNEERHWDSVLGVYLASKNQYAERIS
jgi:hypothetical protein